MTRKVDDKRIVELARRHRGVFRGTRQKDFDGDDGPVMMFAWDWEEDADAFHEERQVANLPRTSDFVGGIYCTTVGG